MANYFKKSLVTTWLFAFAYSSALDAKPLSITVRDQHGAVLSDVVIEYPSANIVKPDRSVAVMDQVNKRFVPQLLVVDEGQAVSFPNSDDIRHHVYSFSPAKTFELKLYAGEPKSPVIFDQHGVVILGCNIHDAMVGYIYVAKSSAVLTDAQGKAFLDLAPRAKSFTLWHPYQKGSPEQQLTHPLNNESSESTEIELTLETSPPSPPDTFEALFRQASIIR